MGEHFPELRGSEDRDVLCEDLKRRALATVNVCGSKNVARTRPVSKAALNPLDKIPKEHPLLDDIGNRSPLHKLKMLGKDLVALVAHRNERDFCLFVVIRTDIES